MYQCLVWNELQLKADPWLELEKNRILLGSFCSSTISQHCLKFMGNYPPGQLQCGGKNINNISVGNYINVKQADIQQHQK